MFSRLLVLVSIIGILIAPALPSAVQPSMAHTPTENFGPVIEAKKRASITADTIAPSAVVNLSAVTGNLPGTVDLSWIAPGDDATTGTASAYVVRYSTTTITDSNWIAAIDLTGEPIPSPAGSIQSMTVSGLTPGQRYHFAIKTQDEVPNISSVSNSPNAVAKAGPFLTYLPLVNVSTSVVPIIPVTTNVLTQTTTQYLSSISSDGAVFTFTQSTPSLNAVAPGEVIVGGAAANAPYGFLRKVSSVSPIGGQLVVATTQATLEDAIQTGAAHISRALAPDQIQGRMQAKGVTLVATPQSLDEFYLTLENVVLYDHDGNLTTTNDQIKADGSIRLEPGFDFNLVVKDWKLKELAFTTSVKETAEIKLKAEVDLASVKKEKEIARYTFSPITVMVGIVPVVIVPVLTVNVGVDGSVHVGVTAGVEQRATILAGLQYAGDVWQPVSDFSNEFYWNPPALSAGLDLKGYAGARLNLLLYGVAGPYADINAYLKLEANIADDPWWTLYGGLEVPVGVKIEVLGHSLADYEGPTIAFGLILAHAQSNNPPNLPFSPYPLNGTVIQNLSADLSWSGGDLDGDTVTYDVYLEAGDETPDVLASNDQIGIAYDSGPLLPNAHYYWRIVVQDEHGATTAGPAWDFTTATGATCPIILTLQFPQANNLTASVNGSVDSICSTITRLNWQWGDGAGDDQWFPASHTYAVSGMYHITATAYNNLGQTQVQTTTAYVGLNTGEMVSIPAGNFQMGCDPAHNGVFTCISNELPLHTIYLNAYTIDKYEVTNAQYAQCVTAGACTVPGSFASYTRPSYYTNTLYANYPVINVDWYQATNYCTWVGKRLPTEAEWEKAARGGIDNRAYPWGDQAPDCALTNFYNNGFCVGDTSQVGSYPAGASPYGVLDMAGNVMEWVNDWWQSDYYSVSPPSNPPGPASGIFKILRGGYWYSDVAANVRVASRYNLGMPDTYTIHTGFRCVGVAPGQ
ncbi:Formylglycine-generating enzyme [Anaerolineae bacterium]|nr:Formylglycine-generating enzyme [Anaerolineae bacterium]